MRSLRFLALLALPGCAFPNIPPGEVTLYLKRGNVELNAPGFSISGDVEDFLYERVSAPGSVPTTAENQPHP